MLDAQSPDTMDRIQIALIIQSWAIWRERLSIDQTFFEDFLPLIDGSVMYSPHAAKLCLWICQFPGANP